MSDKNNEHICPVEVAGMLDSRWRKILQNPKRILRGYVKEGMTVLDMGCGPGFLTVEAAKMVGAKGKVTAADLQQGMLDMIKKKIEGKEIEPRITLHKCEDDSTGIQEQFDFIVAFYIVHETANPENFIKEMKSLLNPSGIFLIVEPSFHVSKKVFNDTLNMAEKAGLKIKLQPKMFFSRAVVLANK